MIRAFCFSFALAAIGSAPLGAQDLSPDTAAAEAAPTTDLGDVWRLIRHKDNPPDENQGPDEPQRRFLVLAPSIGSRPSTGLMVGFNPNMAFYRGDPKTTHISSITGGLRVSQKKQALAGLRFAAFTDGDRWFLQGDNRLWWTSQDSFGVGPDTPSDRGENVRFNFVRVYETAYRNLKPGLFAGFGLNVNVHANVHRNDDTPPTPERSADATYHREHGFAIERQTSSGASVGLLYDTRDNAINARRGWLASAAYRTFFKRFLGGDSTWQALNLDVRTYKSLTRDGRQTLAFWAVGDLVTGGTAPYFDLPATGGDVAGRMARGYAEGRYRGERLVYGEVEYRGSLTRNGLLGFAAFLNTTTVNSTATGAALFDSYAPGAGVGLRVLLNKQSRTNMCIDYGWGRAGSRGFYLGIQEAF